MKALLPYLLFQIDDDTPSLIGHAEYIGRVRDDVFLFKLKLTRDENRELCKAIHAAGDGTYWNIVAGGDNPHGAAIDGYDGEITKAELLTPPCCTDEAKQLEVRVTFKLKGEER